MAYARKQKKTKSQRNFKKGYKPYKKNIKLLKTIKQEINKNIETKQAYKSVINVYYNSAIDSQADLTSVIPNINYGYNVANRVGSQLKPMSLKIQGHLLGILTQNTYSASRIGVRMMIVTPKGYIGYDPAYNSATTWLSTLLRRGASTVGFTGLVADFYSPINTDAITCHYDRKFYIQSPYVPGTNSGDNTTTGSTKFFNINIPVKSKMFKYDSSVGSGLTPTNYNPWLIIGYCHLDASNPDTVTTQIQLNCGINLTYQDA